MRHRSNAQLKVIQNTCFFMCSYAWHERFAFNELVKIAGRFLFFYCELGNFFLVRQVNPIFFFFRITDRARSAIFLSLWTSHGHVSLEVGHRYTFKLCCNIIIWFVLVRTWILQTQVLNLAYKTFLHRLLLQVNAFDFFSKSRICFVSIRGNLFLFVFCDLVNYCVSFLLIPLVAFSCWMNNIFSFVIRWSRDISPRLLSIKHNLVNVSFFPFLRVSPLGLIPIFSVNQVIRVGHSIGLQHRCV